MIYALYLPYHKNEFLCMADEGYEEIAEYPVQFRRVRTYKTKQEMLWAYANTACPASQTIEAKDNKELDKRVKEMDANFANPEWLKENIYPYL